MNTTKLMAQIILLGIKAKRSHAVCDDSWYSCPKSEDSCCDEEQGDECNCGADKHNALIGLMVANIVDELDPVRIHF